MKSNRYKLIILLQCISLGLFAQTPGLSNHGAKITINSNTYMVIAGEAGNFTVESGEVYLYGKIILSGNLVNNTENEELFDAVDNNHTDLVLTGTQNQIIGGGKTKNVHCKNLTVNSGSKAVLHAGKKLSMSGNLINNGTITISADENEQSTLIVDGSISGAGTFKVETYLTSGRNWYVSTPVSGAKSSMFNAASNPVYWYDESKGSTTPWTAINDNTTDLVPYRGYIANMPNPGIVSFSGALNNTTETLTLYRTAGQAKEGFNLVGNPFPSYLNYEAATKQNIMPSVWYRSRNAANNGWIFDTFNLSTGVGISLSGREVTGNIPPMQAFWVRVMPGFSSGSIEFDKALVSHNDVASNRRRLPTNSELQMIRLQVAGISAYDESVVAFHPEATDELDEYDSSKMLNASTLVPDVYSKVGDELLAINTLRTFDGEKRIALGFNTAQANNFQLSATQIRGFCPLTQIKLYDVLLGVEHDLVNDGVYHFQSAKITGMSRFELIVKVPGISTTLSDSEVSGIRFERVNNQLLVLKIADEMIEDKKSKLTVFNAIGSKMYESFISSNTQSIHLAYPPGVYCVNVELNGLCKTHMLVVK